MSMMASTAATADSEGQSKGADEHRTLDEILRVIGDVQHREAVQDDRDEDCAGHGADDIGAAQLAACEHDQRRRDAVEPERGASEHVAASHPRRDENTAQGRKHARNDISDNPVGLDVRPGQVGSRLVTAHSVKYAPPPRPLHEEPEDDSYDRDDDDW